MISLAKKKIIILLFISILVLSSSSCQNNVKKDDTSSIKEISPSSFEDQTDTNQNAVDYTYDSVQLEIGYDIHDIGIITMHGGHIIGTGYILDSERVATYVFFDADPETSEVYLYPYNVTAGHDVDAMSINDEKNILFSERESNLESGNIYTLKMIDPNGNELLSVDLNSFLESDDGIFSLELDDDNNIYAQTSYGKIIVFDQQGSMQFNLNSSSEETYRLVKLPDGTIILPEINDGLVSFSSINYQEQELEELSQIPEIYSFKPGSGDGIDLYLFTDASLYTYNFDNEELNEIFTWLDIELDFAEVYDFCAINSEQFAALCTDSSNNIATITILTKTDEKVNNKEIITLASINPDYSLISQFNQSNDTYRIEVKDYSEYVDGVDDSQAVTKLNTDIIAGEIPDILDLNGLNYESYAKKGVLADLYTYLDNDTNLNRDSLLAGIADQLEYSGGLYAITPSFGIATIVGKTSVVGSDMGWTLEELIELENSSNEGQLLFSTMTGSWFIELYCEMNLNEFVDYEKGTCDFDSDDFIEALEYAKKLGNMETTYEETVEAELRNESALLVYTELETVFSLYNMESYLPEDGLTAVGFPTGSGVGSVMMPTELYGICEATAVGDGAWAFISYLLSRDHSENKTGGMRGIPVLKSLYDEEIEACINPPDVQDSEIADGIYIDGVLYEIESMTQAQADELAEIINTMGGRRSSSSTEILEIIIEECAPFFEGEKTAQAVAQIIQSRLSTYMAEQM